MSEFDYDSIEFPSDIDYEQLLKYLQENDEELDKLVDQYLANDQKWLENEKQLQQLVEKRNSLLKDLDIIEAGNKKFDELMAQIKAIDSNKKTESICDIIYYDNEYTYYPKPIQRVIDITELKKRMNSLSVDSKVANSSSSNKKSTVPSIATQTDNALGETSSQDVKTDMFSDCDVVFDGINTDVKPIISEQTERFFRKPLKPNDEVFAASNNILTHCWKPATIEKVRDINYFSVKFKDKTVVGGTLISHKLIAYNISSSSSLPVGERVIAYFSENTGALNSRRELYSGTVAEPPKNTNSFRYLIFFDKNAFRYVARNDIYLIYSRCPAANIFQDKDKDKDDEVRDYADFLRNYFENYPERPMLKLQKDDKIKVRLQDKWEIARVLDIDASLALISFDKFERSEWIYRGSRRLLDIYKECTVVKTNVKHRAGRSTTRICRRLDQRSNAFVEWNTDEQAEEEVPTQDSSQRFNAEIVILDKEEPNRKRKFRQTARKSTAKPSGSLSSSSCNPLSMIDSELSNPIEVEVEKMPEFEQTLRPFVPHTCIHKCIEGTDENRSFYNENPYHIPIIVGYRREVVRYSNERSPRIQYRGPCGRRLRSIYEVYTYLLDTGSQLDIDLFTFSTGFALFRKSNPVKARLYIQDITRGSELQPISCVNTVDDSDLGNVIYKNVRFPHPDVEFSPDPEFLSCCDCTDNCADSERCSCQQLTIEASDAIRKNKLQHVGYQFKRLNDFIMTGVFECNQRCPCNSKCANRVVQNGIKCRLQLFKTLKKGWGVRVLHDVPKGTFLCIYAAQILNEEAADKEGKICGDEYLADLDYIDVCEHYKEGYESDVEPDDEDYDQSEDDYQDDEDDEDYKYSGKKSKFRSSTVTETPLENSNIVYGGRRRNDEKPRSRFSIREDFFKEDFCYSLDAKKTGNIGRYLNHSCEPNCFVQNVFVDTHDLRFPWVSFFAKKDILAYEELTWDYNYEIGSIPGRKMPCFCGAHRCKKRLL